MNDMSSRKFRAACHIRNARHRARVLKQVRDAQLEEENKLIRAALNCRKAYEAFRDRLLSKTVNRWKGMTPKALASTGLVRAQFSETVTA